MNYPRTIRVLRYLAKIVEAGERGYAVCAANVDNPGLKILFRSYAQQRARFKTDIMAEMARLGGRVKPGSSVRGIIHRGRIDIFSAMTIAKADREKVVLKELMLGERAALRTYERTLKADLPPETRQMVSEQYAQLQDLVQRIRFMQGQDGKRMLVRLCNSREQASLALKALAEGGLHPTTIEQVDVQESIELYEGRGTTVLETCISGAVGGVLWGGLLGGLGGLGAEQTAGLISSAAVQQQSAWPLLSFLVGILAGGLFGAILGSVIGIGISEEDRYLLDQSLRTGGILLIAVVEISQAPQFEQLMAWTRPLPAAEEPAG